MKEVDLLIVQKSARSTGKLATTLTLTNVTDQPVCLLEVSIPDKSGNVTLYAPETVRGGQAAVRNALCYTPRVLSGQSILCN